MLTGRNATQDEARTAPGPRRRGARGVVRHVVRRAPEILVSAPFLVLFLSELLSGAGVPTVAGDRAVLSLQAHDASQLHVLLGPYSRFHWHHPGPLYLYWLAPFYAGSGDSYRGMVLGALGLGLCCAVLAVVLVRAAAARWSPAPASIAAWAAAATLLTFCAVYGLGELGDPWNPLAIILPIVVVGAAAAAVMSGVRWALPILLVAASLAIQTHVGTLPVTVVLVVVSLGGAAWRFRHRLRAWASVTALGAAAFLACWALPLYQQLTRPTGNLSALWSFVSTRQGVSPPPLSRAVDVVGSQLALLSSELGTRLTAPPLAPFGLWRQLLVATLLAVVVAGVVVDVRRRRAAAASLAVVALLACAASLVAAKLVDGTLYAYLTTYATGAAILLWIAALTAAARAATAAHRWLGYRRSDAGSVALRTLCALVVLAASVTLAVRSSGAAPVGRSEDDPTVAALADAAMPLTRGSPSPTVLVDIYGRTSWGVAAGLANALEEHGVHTTVPASWTFIFGARRATTGTEPVHLLVVSPAVRELALPAGSRLLAGVPTEALYLLPPHTEPLGTSRRRGPG